MTEPIYSFVRGQGWVPSTDEGIEVGWSNERLTSVSKEELASKVHNPEDFFVFLKHLDDGVTGMNALRAMNPNFCTGWCFECERTFNRAMDDYNRMSGLLRENHLARLDAAVELWYVS